MTTLVPLIKDLQAAGVGSKQATDAEAAAKAVEKHWDQLNKCNDDLLNYTTMGAANSAPNLVIVTDGTGITDIASDAPEKLGSIIVLDQSDSDDNIGKPQLEIPDYASGAATVWSQVTALPESLDFSDLMDTMMKADLPTDDVAETEDGMTIDVTDDD